MCRMPHAPVTRCVGHPRRGRRATHVPEESLPICAETHTASLRPTRTSQPGDRSHRVASASARSPSAEAAVALSDARLLSRLPAETGGFPRSRRYSASYGSACPAATCTTRPGRPCGTRASPEGAPPRDPPTFERTLAPSSHRPSPTRPPRRPKPPRMCFAEAKHLACAAPPRARRHMAWAVASRRKPGGQLLTFVPPPQAAKVRASV